MTAYSQQLLIAQRLKAHPLYGVARSFAALPAAANPILNPDAKARLPAHLLPHVEAIAADTQLASVATGGATDNATTGGTSTMNNSNVAPGQSQAHRLPSVRHQICGAATLTFGGAGAQSLVFTPQMRFKGNRLVIPSGQLAGGTFSNLMVGIRPQYAAASQEPLAMFEEQSTGGLWDMDVCETGQKIQATVTVTGACTVNACIIGEALDGRPYPIIRSPLKRIGFQTPATVAAGATASIVLVPQTRFKPRKLVFDDATAKYFTIIAFNIGMQPQFASGDPVPGAAFTELAEDVWLDCDEATVGNVITLQVTNNDAGAHLFGGALMGDAATMQAAA